MLPTADHRSNDDIRQQMGERVRAHRRARRYSQQALAERAGISRPTLSAVERGRDVSVDTLLSVLRALDLLDSFDSAVPEPAPSPIDELDGAAPRRRRATAPSDGGSWRWGDET